MRITKRKKLERAGWRVGTAAEFLGLSAEEAALVSIRLALADNLRLRRQRLRLTQVELAKRMGSSQSRIAKMEMADRSVSLDLLVRSLLSLGASRQDVGAVLAMKQPREIKSRQRADVKSNEKR